jgi:hypothetical protein
MLEVLEQDVARLGELLGRAAPPVEPAHVPPPFPTERPAARAPAQLGLF